jgi:hypothetical protein
LKTIELPGVPVDVVATAETVVDRVQEPVDFLRGKVL